MKRYTIRTFTNSYRITQIRFMSDEKSIVTETLNIQMDSSPNFQRQIPSISIYKRPVLPPNDPRILTRLLTIKKVLKIEDFDDLNFAIQEINKFQEIGFDSEWYQYARHISDPPHLVQLSTPQRAFLFPFRYDRKTDTSDKNSKTDTSDKNSPAVLFRLKVFDGLKRVLEDDKIKKVGFDLVQDNKYLFCNHGIKVNNFLDIKTEYKFSFGMGLLIDHLFPKIGFKKTKSLQMSKWTDFKNLSERELLYAGNDAYLSLLAHQFLKNDENLVKEIGTITPRPKDTSRIINKSENTKILDNETSNTRISN